MYRRYEVFVDDDSVNTADIARGSMFGIRIALGGLPWSSDHQTPAAEQP